MVIDDFTAHMKRRKMSANTIRLRLFYLRKFEARYPELTTVTTEDIEVFLDGYSHLAAETQKSVTGSLRVFFKWAVYRGLVPRDPMFPLPQVRVPHRESRIASEAQIGMALFSGSREDQAMVRLGAECGLRASEIAALDRKSRAGEWLTIIGKGGKQRTVHLSPELLDLLVSIERKGMRKGFYFPSYHPDGHIHVTTVWRHITKILKSNPHSLRHRAGTTVYYNGGKDIRLAQEFLGHASSTTTEIYIHVGRDRLRLAGEAARFTKTIEHPDILPMAA